MFIPNVTEINNDIYVKDLGGSNYIYCVATKSGVFGWKYRLVDLRNNNFEMKWLPFRFLVKWKCKRILERVNDRKS